jgi:hypothetical protein
MFITDPFVIGPAEPLTENQKAKRKLDAEWSTIGTPTLEERIETRNRVVAEHLKREFEEK